MHFNYPNSAVDGDCRSLFEKCIQENSIYKEPCVLKEKKKNEVKLNSDHLFHLATL